jgi:hypothetical protein
MRRAWLALALWALACGHPPSTATAPALDAAAESYVRLVLALGERDADSLDAYHGPPEWQAGARRAHATLPEVRAAAASLAERLESSVPGGDEVRRQFLIRQLRAVVARIDVVRGARRPFAEEAYALFGLDVPAGDHGTAAAAVRLAIDRLLPGRGDLPARYAAFDRKFLIPPDRLRAVLLRAIEGCRVATRAHVGLPPAERVDVEYVRELPWSAFTRYQGGFTSRIQVNAGLPLTVDRALDLACHETYPGHHTIATLLDARFGGRVEFLVQPLFSPQSMLHEAASSLAGVLAFSEPARMAFERDELFPLAGLDPADAARHTRVGRLVDELHGVHADIVRRYLDGGLDFPRAAAALERDALMPSADATLKFLNQYRTYAATYTSGRDELMRYIEAHASAGDEAGRWRAYTNVVADPAQIVPHRRVAQAFSSPTALELAHLRSW